MVFAETLMQEGSSTTINLILHTTLCIRILLMNQIQYVSFPTFDFYQKCEYSSCYLSRIDIYIYIGIDILISTFSRLEML